MTPFSILFIDTFYPEFLNRLYSQNPDLRLKSYEDQLATQIDYRFGDSDYYLKGFRESGWVAHQTVVNCPELQEAWGKQFRSSFNYKDAYQAVVAHVKHHRPSVVYFQNLLLASSECIAAIRPYCSLIVGQIASEVPSQTHLAGFDLIISSLPSFVKNFREKGLASHYIPLAFEPKLLDEIETDKRDLPLTFVGGLASDHHEGRRKLLSKLVSHPQISLYGYGFERIAQSQSTELTKFKGEAWGKEMFSILGRSRLTVNIHADFAGDYANNMRLFEATGMGSLLITDYKSDLQNIFRIGKEVVAYRSPEECYALIDYYINNPEEASKIARRGQQRTLKDHSYQARTLEIAERLEFLLALNSRRSSRPQREFSLSSSSHKSINASEVTENLRQAWKDPALPEIQRELVDNELAQMYHGTTVDPYKAMFTIMENSSLPNDRILEVGCASGHYYEVLKYLLKHKVSYVGVDFSPALISLGKNCYPHAKLFVADGAALPYASKEFDIAISSCVLLHVEAYSKHIEEICRVANNTVVLHRTPVCREQPTNLKKKSAYGQEMFEFTFNETEIMELVSNQGFSLAYSYVLSENPNLDQYNISYVFSRLG